MCGIYGKINFKTNSRVEESLVRQAVSGMFSRGPDEDGFFFQDNLGMGMRRLNIIDIKSGSQPIFNESGDTVIIFNGEIYNYSELRENLLSKGHRFKTQSDTEVILHLYEDAGTDCLRFLNGMFAFAIWNSNKKELFIARDRLGIKPLYYSLYGESLTFSSEIRSMLCDRKIPRDTDPEALNNYFSFYYVSAPHTIFRHIKRLPPASYMLVRKGSIEIKKYWKYKFEKAALTESEVSEMVDDVFLSSVKRHLQSEVPVGVFLSSGLDSTSIVAMMNRLSQKINTYTIGYANGGGYNELKEAYSVAKMYGTSHHECFLKPGDIEDIIPGIAEYSAEPNGDWTQAALFHLSKESKRDVTVVLSGAGGDELFAGYPTLTAAKIAAYYRIVPEPIKKLIKSVVMKLPANYSRLSFDFKAKAFISGADLPPELGHFKYKEIFSDEEKGKLLYNNKNLGDSFSVFRQYLGDVEEQELLNRLLYLDMNVFLPDCVLNVTDAVTMMNSQECRVPFLDLEMIELSQKISMNLKLKGFTTKYILRKVFGKYLPKEIAKMPKKGLSMPTAIWLKDELKNFVSDIFSDAEKNNRDFMDFNYIRNLFYEHKNGKRDNTRKITCLVSFFLWQKYYQ
ncbi:MAG: Asparagine synthetase (glutamine-hydrolyzing) 1 [Elusimicrobia bacterium ADurb.Bin231]|nr:MAG: Asparagine synthetase (glutamine-hydrolyzing) 1 [Elusimicrobia bacterium ADurb.Bin231]